MINWAIVCVCAACVAQNSISHDSPSYERYYGSSESRPLLESCLNLMSQSGQRKEFLGMVRQETRANTTDFVLIEIGGPDSDRYRAIFVNNQGVLLATDPIYEFPGNFNLKVDMLATTKLFERLEAAEHSQKTGNIEHPWFPHPSCFFVKVTRNKEQTANFALVGPDLTEGTDGPPPIAIISQVFDFARVHLPSE